MDIHPIKTSDDHEQPLLRIDELMNARPGTEGGGSYECQDEYCYTAHWRMVAEESRRSIAARRRSH